jgi:signal transduction histidine kinase
VKRLLPSSLIGQMAVLIGVALLIAQLANFALILNERQKLSLAQNQGPAISRFVSVASDLSQAPSEFRFALIQDASRRGAQFRLSRSSSVPATAARAERAEERLRQGLEGASVAASEIRASQAAIRRTGRSGRAADLQLLLLSARLGDSWLNARFVTPRPDPWLSYRLIGATLLLYLIVLGATLFIATRLARPLRDLTEAAERFGGREPPPAVEPRGPDDLRQAIEAFNAMNGRLVALLDEKDRMLGAIGHDLRTPLASLRIRAESVEDETERGRMIATIGEMSAMLEDILVLARSGRAREEARATDVAALADAIAEEYAEFGKPAAFLDSGRQVAKVQPNLLRRAIRNLVDNAIKYGGSAEIAVRRDGERLVVEVSDHGPGLAQDEVARVLEPFYRVEGSRNRDTGGAGLGLAIARAVAESHGGTLALRNREGGGLVASILLPAA